MVRGVKIIISRLFYNFLIFRTFGYFGLFGLFLAYIIPPTDLRFFFDQKFEICQNWLTWLSTPPNQKDLSSQSLRHQKNDTFVTFWPFFALLGIFGFLSYFGPILYDRVIWDFFLAKKSKSVKIDLFDCLPPLTKRIWVPNG